MITLQGVRPKMTPTLTAVQSTELCKLIAGNDIWAMAMVEMQPPRPKSRIPSQTLISDLLEEFADVFTKGLSSSVFRHFRSSLNILPSTVRTAGGVELSHTL